LLRKIAVVVSSYSQFSDLQVWKQLPRSKVKVQGQMSPKLIISGIYHSIKCYQFMSVSCH